MQDREKQEAQKSSSRNTTEGRNRSDSTNRSGRSRSSRRRSSRSRQQPRDVSARQPGSGEKPNSQGGESDRGDGQGRPSPRRRRSPRGRGPEQHRTANKPQEDIVAVKDNDINVDRIMKRLSKRASEIDHEIIGSQPKGIIDTTKQGPRHSKEDSNEAVAVEFVKRAVANDEVLSLMSSEDWNLDTDYKVSSHRRTIVAAPLVLLKRVIRRFVRLYADFLVIRQNRINSYLVRLCSKLVRDLVSTRLEYARELARLEALLERQEAKFSSTVAAINARFDNDEARLDLLRSEFEIRTEVMRDELETERLLAVRDDAPTGYEPEGEVPGPEDASTDAPMPDAPPSEVSSDEDFAEIEQKHESIDEALAQDVDAEADEDVREYLE